MPQSARSPLWSVFLYHSPSRNYCNGWHGESAISMGVCFWLSLVHNRDCYITCISTGWCGAYHMTSCTCSTSWTTAALSTRLILPATLNYVRVGLSKSPSCCAVRERFLSVLRSYTNHPPKFLHSPVRLCWKSASVRP
jgi:hypothetical protein